MTVPHTFVSVTEASFPADQWSNALPLLESWKSLLQSLPGHLVTEVLATRRENQDIACLIRVSWEYRDQLEEFLASDWQAEVIISKLQPPPYDVASTAWEQLL